MAHPQSVYIFRAMDSVFGLVGNGYVICFLLLHLPHLLPCFLLLHLVDIFTWFLVMFHISLSSSLSCILFDVKSCRYALIAADAAAARSILVFKHDEDKVYHTLYFLRSN